MADSVELRASAPPSVRPPWQRPRAGLVPAFVAALRREPAPLLTGALALPAVIAALVVNRLETASASVLVAAIAVAAQWLIGSVVRQYRILGRRDLLFVQLLVGLVVAAVLLELVMPDSYALYVPVVAVAAAVGTREALVIGIAAMALYLLPLIAAPGPIDPALVTRGVAGAAVSGLVAAGAREFIGARDAVMRDLRASVRRERRRARQLTGIEEVGRLLAASGPTREALSRIMDVLVGQFGYQYVSIYLMRDDGVLELGAQRGYAAPIDTFDGSTGVVGRVLRQRQAELIPDVRHDRDYVAANPDVLSEVSAPLIEDGRVLGIVNVESCGTVLDDSDFRSIVAIADRVAAYLALGRERQWLAELTVRDPLTGLHNRRYLEERLETMLAARARLEPRKRRPLSIVLFDLDHFGQLNKKHGHGLGDQVLRSVAALLATRFRGSDFVARYGGEEFLVVLDGATLWEAAARADDLRTALEKAVLRDVPEGVAVTVSAGCASLAPGDEVSWDDLRAAADVALGMAKRAGRNQVVSAAL